MLKQRIITTLLGIPLLIITVCFGEPYFTILIALAGLLAALEFYKILSSSKIAPLTYLGLAATLLLIISPHYSFILPQVEPGLVMSLVIASIIALSLIWIVLRPHKEGAFAGWVWTIAGIFYIGWLLSYFPQLRGLEEGRNWVLFAFFVTFASDSAAFLVGRKIGKHPLAPAISPKKTWEGAIAGVSAALIMSLLFVLPTPLKIPMSLWHALALGLLVSVFGQMGDLVESLFKRNMQIKDSGKLLPGHGGFLDRIDSILFAGVVVYYYALLNSTL